MHLLPASPARKVDTAPSSQATCPTCGNQGLDLRRKSVGRTSQRFNVVSLLPNAVLVLFVVALHASGAPDTTPSLKNLLEDIDSLNLERVAALSVVVLVVSLILHPFQFSLVRMLEGYWDGSSLGRALSAIGTELHRRRRERLETAFTTRPQTPEQGRLRQQAGVQLRRYPAEDRLLPTRLGNTLRAAEDQAGPRYNLPTIAAMPRLYPYLSDRFAAVYVDRRNQLDLAVRFCTVLMLATLIAAGMLLPNGGPWRALPLATALLAWISYHGAVRAAYNYGQALHVAFDLHRFDMLKALHYPLPGNLDQERTFNRRVTDFLINNIPRVKGYDHEPPPS
jgi:hypothetical protein